MTATLPWHGDGLERGLGGAWSAETGESEDFAIRVDGKCPRKQKKPSEEPSAPQAAFSRFYNLSLSLVIPAGFEPALPVWEIEPARIPPDFITFFYR